MKKIIAIMLVLVLTLFSFAACNKEEANNPTSSDEEYVPAEKFDGEKLKETWTAGEITFENGNKIMLPCSIEEFVEQSGLKITNEQNYANKQYKPGNVLNLQLVGENIQVKIDCENLGTSDVGYLDTTVVGFNFYNSAKGNKAITVAAGLTVGITRTEVEESLGIPEGQTTEDRLYTYKTDFEDGQRIRMNVSFNSSGIVNAISYKLDN